MDEQNNNSSGEKNNSRLIWIIIPTIILLMMILSGMGVYFWQEASMARISAEHEIALTQCNKDGLAEKNNQQPESAKADSASIKLPIVQFVPATFTEEEKKELMEKVINPYVDYQKEMWKVNPISIQVKKHTKTEIDNQIYARYMYGIDVITETGYHGWLEREEGKAIDYWIPDCMGECPFSESYKAKYQEVLKKYNDLFSKQKGV